MNHLIVENGIITNIIVSDESFASEIGALPHYNGAEIGQPYSPPRIPTAEEDRDAMLVDLEYRMTLLELGVN